MGAGISVLLMFGLAFLMLASYWTVFEKAGKPGWYALIPLWNIYQMVKLAGMSGWSMLLLFVPIVNLFYAFGLNMRIARNFGQSEGFGVGLTLFGLFFWPLLAFGPAEYVGHPAHIRKRTTDQDGNSLYQNEDGDWVEEIPLKEW